MTTVLHTIDTTGPGGAETVFINLVKSLPGDNPVVAIRGPGWVCDTLRKNGIEPVFVDSRGGFNVSYLADLVKIIRRYRVDVVQSHLFGSNLYSSLAGLICRVPVISVFHGFVDTNKGERFLPVKARIINSGSKKIVFVSDRLRQHYISQYGLSGAKATTIYNGVDTDVFYPRKDDSIRKELGLGPENVLIGAVGNIRPAKGYDNFLRAARIIHSRHPECRFVVAGQGSGALYDSLLELRRELGLEGIFYFIGFRENPPAVLNNLDIFVLPSVSEGFSISTIEAMACGVPVVVTRSGGPEEIVENGVNGLTVDSGPEDIAGGIMRIFEKADLGNSLKNTAFAEVEEKFSLRAMVEQYRLCHGPQKEISEGKTDYAGTW
ncbi:glycosyltransferase involved in cell wall biosynthesis [Desulfosalsimonas propionicica]|uniref:Glycosyltransferase involved in cell wall biosynthesis n=1 Tax=Desulfosalsimonas propionicica TaxID=332175 RepID=A0A7W0CC43_9BACT|nr:glycosyltransferase [Desulfosalsimonas propionicica]MBA2883000.1 glycosyltransferase involved in cell wall biosynthesis [Desulfosalsimonas propionicica]